MPHPIHMHGHHFHVLKIGYPTYDPETGQVDQQNTDIYCDTPSCNKPSWKEEAWKNGNVPGLNLDNPPIKDTIIVPRGGYIVGRITTDNPGKIRCFLIFLGRPEYFFWPLSCLCTLQRQSIKYKRVYKRFNPDLIHYLLYRDCYWIFGCNWYSVVNLL